MARRPQVVAYDMLDRVIDRAASGFKRRCVDAARQAGAYDDHVRPHGHDGHRRRPPYYQGDSNLHDAAQLRRLEPHAVQGGRRAANSTRRRATRRRRTATSGDTTTIAVKPKEPQLRLGAGQPVLHAQARRQRDRQVPAKPRNRIPNLSANNALAKTNPNYPNVVTNYWYDGGRQHGRPAGWIGYRDRSGLQRTGTSPAVERSEPGQLDVHLQRGGRNW